MGITNKKNEDNSNPNPKLKRTLETKKSIEKMKLNNEINKKKNTFTEISNIDNKKNDNLIKEKNIDKNHKYSNFLKIEKKFNNQLVDLKNKLLKNSDIKYEIKYFIKKNENLIKTLQELYKEELKKEDNFESNISIHRLILKNNYKKLRNLLLSGYNPNETNFEGHTPLYLSIINEKKKITKLLTQFNGELLWSEIPKKTLTQHAVESDINSIKLKLFLNKNEIDLTSFSETGKTALSSSVYFKKFDSVELLLKRGANPDVKDNEGKVALHYAYKIGLKCYKVLKKFNCCLDISDKKGFNPFHYACVYGNKSILEFFIENGSDIEKTTLNKENGILLAAAEGNIDIVQCLVNNGVDVNSINISKQSALHYSVINEKFKMTSFLLENGAFTNLRDINDKTPLDYSKKVSNYKISKLIEKWK